MPDGVVVAVRLTPKAGRDAIEGLSRLGDGRTVLKARVRAAPTGGQANTGLEQLLAAMLGVAASRISVVAGASARIKRVKIAGNPTALTGALERLVGVSPAPRN